MRAFISLASFCLRPFDALNAFDVMVLIDGDDDDNDVVAVVAMVGWRQGKDHYIPCNG